MRRRLLIVAVIGAGLLVAGGTASAAPPAAVAPGATCWRTLVDDLYDGRIGSPYQVQCYRNAVHHLPCNAIYGALCDDVERSMASGVARLHDRGIAVDASTVIPPADAFLAAAHHGRAIRLGFVLKLAAAAVLVALLVVWVVVRLRQPSRR